MKDSEPSGAVWHRLCPELMWISHGNKVNLSEDIKGLKLQTEQEFKAGFKGSPKGPKVLQRGDEWTIKCICLSELNTSYLCGCRLTKCHFLVDKRPNARSFDLRQPQFLSNQRIWMFFFFSNCGFYIRLFFISTSKPSKVCPICLMKKWCHFLEEHFFRLTSLHFTAIFGTLQRLFPSRQTGNLKSSHWWGSVCIAVGFTAQRAQVVLSSWCYRCGLCLN